MRTRRSLLAFCSLTILALGLMACSSTEETAEVVHDPAEWQALQDAQQALIGKRQELGTLRTVIDGSASEETAANFADIGEEELGTNAEALNDEVVSMAYDFVGSLVEFINKSINADGEETEIHQQAIRMKSDEDLATGQDFIDRGGEYQRAIDIFQQSLAFDPEYQALHDAIAKANDLRFMSEERFAEVKKKMTQAEVRKLLGALKGTNIQEFPERNVVGWFYRKDNGGAAAVYFKEKRKDDGNWLVYEADYDAIKPKVIGSDGNEEKAADG